MKRHSTIKLVLSLFIALTLTSCHDWMREKPDSKELDHQYIEVVEYDGCEYIKKTYSSDVLCHKGNCKYCEQRRKHEWQQMIDDALTDYE